LVVRYYYYYCYYRVLVLLLFAAISLVNKDSENITNSPLITDIPKAKPRLRHWLHSEKKTINLFTHIIKFAYRLFACKMSCPTDPPNRFVQVHRVTNILCLCGYYVDLHVLYAGPQRKCCQMQM